jgi:hypothetical protein
MSFITEVENGITKLEGYVTDIATDVQKVFAKAEKLEPSVAAALLSTYTAVQTFLATASTAVAGTGINFPADSAAYAAFLNLVKVFEADGALIKAAI